MIGNVGQRTVTSFAPILGSRRRPTRSARRHRRTSIARCSTGPSRRGHGLRAGAGGISSKACSCAGTAGYRNCDPWNKEATAACLFAFPRGLLAARLPLTPLILRSGASRDRRPARECPRCAEGVRTASSGGKQKNRPHGRVCFVWRPHGDCAWRGCRPRQASGEAVLRRTAGPLGRSDVVPRVHRTLGTEPMASAEPAGKPTNKPPLRVAYLLASPRGLLAARLRLAPLVPRSAASRDR